MKYIPYIKEKEKYMDITNVVLIVITNGIQRIVGLININNAWNVEMKHIRINKKSFIMDKDN